MLLVKNPTYSHLYLCKSFCRHKLNICLAVQRSFSTPAAQNISESIAKTNNFVVNCNSQITKYGRSGNIKEAESLFRRMPEKSVVTYTAMLSAHANNGKIESARTPFEEMPQGTVATWNAMIMAYVRNTKR